MFCLRVCLSDTDLQHPLRPKEDIRPSRAGVMDGCEQLCGCENQTRSSGEAAGQGSAEPFLQRYSSDFNEKCPQSKSMKDSKKRKSKAGEEKKRRGRDRKGETDWWQTAVSAKCFAREAWSPLSPHIKTLVLILPVSL